ncbi:MAG TPA: transposase [Pirellulales bacterium]|nr:transposase [Pirellulales bacterium]
MGRTLGYHYVKSGYGLWLPGDSRGHWSEAWDEQIGFIEPHMLHGGDPVRERMARERMKQPPVRLDTAMIAAVEKAISACAASSPWKIVAASIESTHLHLLLTYSGMDIERTAKWLAQQMTKEVHAQTKHEGPVFCKNYWCSYMFDESHWRNTIRYIERHNERRGEVSRPYPFLYGGD